MTVGGLLLFHGAGGDRDHPTFLALQDRLETPVARINFPYRQKGPGRRFPDRMPRLIDAVVEATEHWAETWSVQPGDLVLGGRSMGGRAASMAIADGMAATGLLLLSYPLHPPGKPDKLRVDHLHRVDCPTLLIQGNRDPFGKPDEFAEHLSKLVGPLEQSWIEANHDPRGHDDHIVTTVSDWLFWLGSH